MPSEERRFSRQEFLAALEKGWKHYLSQLAELSEEEQNHFAQEQSSKEERRSRNVPDRQTYLRKPPLQQSHTDKSLASSCSKMVEACWPKRAKITWRRLVGFLICSITVESAMGAASVSG